MVLYEKLCINWNTILSILKYFLEWYPNSMCKPNISFQVLQTFPFHYTIKPIPIVIPDFKPNATWETQWYIVASWLAGPYDIRNSSYLAYANS